MNTNSLLHAVTRSASETLSSTIFEDRFPPYVLTVVSYFIVILTNKKRCCLSFGGKIQIQVKILELHVHF